MIDKDYFTFEKLNKRKILALGNEKDIDLLLDAHTGNNRDGADTGADRKD